jgi:hypothetical protein
MGVVERSAGVALGPVAVALTEACSAGAWVALASSRLLGAAALGALLGLHPLDRVLAVPVGAPLLEVAPRGSEPSARSGSGDLVAGG